MNEPTNMQQTKDGNWVPSVPMRRATWLEVMLDRWIGPRTGHPWRSVLRGVVPGQYGDRAIRERRQAAKVCICPSHASNLGECLVHDEKGRVRVAGGETETP